MMKLFSLSKFKKPILSILFIIASVLVFVLINKVADHLLLQRLTTAVQSQSEKIQLPDVIDEDSHISRCSYDYKRKAKRCNIRLTKYFVTDSQPIEQFALVDEYIKGLDWSYVYNNRRSLEEHARMIEKGYMPFEIYQKRDPHPMQVHLRFASEQHPPYDPIMNSLFEQYSKDYASIYSVSISTDFISR